MKTQAINGRVAANPWKNKRRDGWKIFCDSACAEKACMPKHLHHSVINYEGSSCDYCNKNLGDR